jgi:lysophospholipid acyltransferase (LPLAT)-like uncharacterized protein
VSEAAADAAKAAKAAKAARKVRWAVRLGKPLLTLLAWTWRVEEVNTGPWRALAKAGKPYILSSWHGQLLVHIWANRFRNIAAMISEHGDGEIIARMMISWGFVPVRGSSTRGGRRALVEMVEQIQGGRAFAITPDGPRGPAGVLQPGVLIASYKGGAPIITIRSEASRAWRLGNWDRFEIPKPFARVRIIYGDPWQATATDDAAAAQLLALMGPAHATLMGPPK